MRKQRLIGAALVLLSVLILVSAAAGRTPDEQDATIVLLILPWGLYMICTKNYMLWP